MDHRSNFHPSRSTEFSNVVYGGPSADPGRMREIVERSYPGKTPYTVYFGELHGHGELCDGQGTLDAYFTAARDLAKLDFCAASNHDHGGVGDHELWGEKWDLVQRKVREYHRPGEFITLLGYERDSFPFYPNMCLYYIGDTGEMVRGAQDGEIALAELEALAAREDILFIPHQISQVEVGVNWKHIPAHVAPPVCEMYSKWGASEYLGNARPIRSAARGNSWCDALELGLKIGAIAGSDIHTPFPGLRVNSGGNIRWQNPGIAGVLAKDLSRESIFRAIRARRTYACEGVRPRIEFRVNGAHMGEEITARGDEGRAVYIEVHGDGPLESVTVVKNGRDEFIYTLYGSSHWHQSIVIDYEAERPTDYYYLRIVHADGRRAWTSPVWVEREEG